MRDVVWADEMRRRVCGRSDTRNESGNGTKLGERASRFMSMAKDGARRR